MNVEAGKTKDIQTNLGTDLEKQSVSITHPKSEGNEPGIFSIKLVIFNQTTVMKYVGFKF